MVDLFRKANAPYIIAGTLATLTLISSLVLAITSPVSFPLILALATLSVLVIVLLYKVIKNNRKIEDDRDKSAKKEQELKNKITLEKEAVNKQVEELNNQLNKLAQEKQNLDKRAKELDEKVVRLEAEKKSLGQVLENSGISEITKKLAKEKDELIKQTQELMSGISRLCKQLQEKENDIAQKAERVIELKIEIDSNRDIGLENKESCKEGEKLSKKKEKSLQRIKKRLLHKEEPKKELCKKQGESDAELDDRQHDVARLIKEKENLFKELNNATKLFEGEYTLWEEIIVGCYNKISVLNVLLTEKDKKIDELEKDLLKKQEDLLKKQEEEVVFMRDTIEYIIGEVKMLVRESKEIIDHDKEIVLQAIQKIGFRLEKEVAQYLLSDTSRVEKDRGYDSGRSTPVNVLYDITVTCQNNDMSKFKGGI